MYQSAPYRQIRIVRQLLPFLSRRKRFQAINVVQAVRHYHALLLWREGRWEIVRASGLSRGREELFGRDDEVRGGAACPSIVVGGGEEEVEPDEECEGEDEESAWGRTGPGRKGGELRSQL